MLTQVVSNYFLRFGLTSGKSLSVLFHLLARWSPSSFQAIRTSWNSSQTPVATKLGHYKPLRNSAADNNKTFFLVYACESQLGFSWSRLDAGLTPKFGLNPNIFQMSFILLDKRPQKKSSSLGKKKEHKGANSETQADVRPLHMSVV